jgi:hypothetical protein
MIAPSKKNSLRNLLVADNKETKYGAIERLRVRRIEPVAS